MTAELKEYVLGTGADELERLALQHRFWADAAHQAWRSARIRIGQRVLDVGCGPGFAAFDLAQLVTRSGAVVGVDESVNFIGHLNEQAGARRLPHLRGLVSDVGALDQALAEETPFDLAYARWVLCFVRDPEQVISAVGRRLRPEGRFVIQDYFNYESFCLAPKDLAHDHAVAASIASWRDRGGDTDVVGRVPGLLRAQGFEIEQMQVHARMARPDETMFQWPLIWWRIYAPKLVQMGFLSAADCEALLQRMESAGEATDQFIQCPLVYEVIARKRSA